MIASNTITKASNFMLSSFVQEIKVLNFLPMAPVLSGIAEIRSTLSNYKKINSYNILLHFINYVT